MKIMILYSYTYLTHLTGKILQLTSIWQTWKPLFATLPLHLPGLLCKANTRDKCRAQLQVPRNSLLWGSAPNHPPKQQH